MPRVNVRFAEKEDIPALIELIAEFAEYERCLHMVSIIEFYLRAGAELRNDWKMFCITEDKL